MASIILCALVFGGLGESGAEAQSQLAPSAVESQVDLDAFEAHLETLRQALKIPGLSAAVVRDQELIWARGFGYADLERQIAATPDTPYGLASVTKPIAAVLVMQLVEGGWIDLDAPISQYGVVFENAQSITVRHLMTHTSEGVPGTRFHYHGDRYALLGGVIEGATGKTFAENLSERVLLPLDMMNTALNPISSWGGGDRSGWGNLERSLGLGKLYQNYPDVYARLAKPYQFDREYNPIPGMYHLHHSPAAGLVSSVADLARFDIALDQGVLLADETKAEMFAPAYSTYQNRQDMQYGLGWYVQQFEGLELLWHTGRWPPSTSALYLKVPEKHLTFIVLANTDNLTTPFDGIGHGDVSKSALVLSFFRHFIYPEQTGSPLVDVNWAEPRKKVIDQLAAVQDGPERRYLERELWAFRQVYASVGRDDQVRKLWLTSMRAFPLSDMRSDPLFANTASRSAYVPPILSAANFHRISWGIAAWFACVIASLLWMLITLLRARGVSAIEWAVWLLATGLLGPLALIAYKLVHALPGRPTSRWQRALGASIFSITPYVIGWMIALTLLENLGSQPHPLLILSVSYLTPLLFTLVVFRLPPWFATRRLAVRKRQTGSLLSEIILFSVGFAVLFAMTLTLDHRVLTTIPGLSSPFYWAMLPILASAGSVALFPIAYWLAHSGQLRWQAPTPESRVSETALPTLRTAWPHLLVSLFFMIVSLALTISLVA